jgi:hypothetical protein
LTEDQKYLAKHKYCQKSRSKNGVELLIILLWIFAILHFVLGSHLILERNMSFLCLPVVLKSKDASFKGYYFDQTPTCKIKTSQSSKIKSVLIAEMTQYLLK